MFSVRHCSVSQRLLFLMNTNLVNTPQELSLKREVQNYELQFDILNRKMQQMEQVLGNIEERDNNLYRLYFEANPIPEEQRRAGFGGVNRYKSLEGFNNSEIIDRCQQAVGHHPKANGDPIEVVGRNRQIGRRKRKTCWRPFPPSNPFSNEDLTRMASGYGWRTDPFTKARKMHHGMDFTAPRGTPIYASGNGKIIRADNRSSGFGKHIRIDHGYGYMTIVCPLEQIQCYRRPKGQAR